MSENLTPEERQAINDLLSRPLDFPAKFKSWFIDYMAQNLPPLPVDHLEGYVKTRGYGQQVAPGAITIGAGWGSLGVGPSFFDIPAGDYLMIWGMYCPNNVHSGVIYRMGPAVDGGSNPSDSNACKVSAGSTGNSGARARVITVGQTATGLGSLEFKYRADQWSGSGSGASVDTAFASIVRVS